MIVHDLEEFQAELGGDAIEGDYRPVAVHSIKRDQDSTMGTGGCSRIETEFDLRRQDKSTWEEAHQRF